ncbi:MAG: response regulator [Bacteroidetes bacterium]|nr:response regulator [Bacteroidota bacterium]
MKKRQKTGLHILIIDDDEFLLGIIEKKLVLSGYKVTACNNVHDAIFKLGLIRPDMILLDIIMPDMNGLELMYLMQLQFSAALAPIVLMSRLNKREIYEMGYDIGNAGYLEKPFDLNQLQFVIEQAEQSAGTHEEWLNRFG